MKMINKAESSISIKMVNEADIVVIYSYMPGTLVENDISCVLVLSIISFEYHIRILFLLLHGFNK